MHILLRFIILTLAVLALPYVIPGITVIGGIKVALLVAVCLSFINLVIRPVIGILTLPINILTLGIFSIIINALLFWSVTSVVSGFEVNSFTAALFGALAISVLNWILSKFLD